MPHFIVEYANNLPEDALAIDRLLSALCQTAVDTKLFPETGLRARAYRADAQRVAGSDPSAAFVHVAMNVGKGRDIEARRAAGESIFNTLKAHMAPLMNSRTVLLSFEMREIDDVKFNFKNT